MTAALTFLAALFSSPWLDLIFVLCVACIAYCTVAEWRDRSRHIDAVLNTLLPEADERLIEHERQRMRAEQAVQRREAAERRMRGAR